MMNLSKDKSLFLRGICTISIVIVHLFQILIKGTVSSVVAVLGSTCVSIFFFLSGYGLAKSVEKHRSTKLSFLLKKIVPFYISCLFFVGIYSIYYAIFGGFDLSIFGLSFLYGGTIIVSGWYVQTLLIMYLIFWISLILIKRKPLSISLFVGLFLVFFVISIILEPRENIYKYITSPLFAVGTLFGLAKESETSVLSKKSFCLGAGISSIVTGAIFVILCFFLETKGVAFEILFKGLYNIFLTIGIILVFKVLPAKSVLIEEIGSDSLSFYLSQGLFMVLFEKLKFPALIYTLVVLVCVAYCGFGFGIIIKKFNQLWLKLTNKTEEAKI